MQSKEEGNLVLARFFTDEDIYESLKEVCRKHDIETAVVVCGLGQLKQFTLGYFKEKGNYTPQEYEKPHELLSLDGIISREKGEYSFHLHAVLGNENKEAIGGHLIKGKVQVTNEIALIKTGVRVQRRLDEDTGLQALYLES
ncbi:MAG: DUF296 domain-containing protein [Dehalococcoidia bacterium]|nr:DUF296 domain-containing protein [Dehalococcoidia bacterium]